MSEHQSQSEVTNRLMGLVADGRYDIEQATLALGAWSTWHHHPELREDLWDGTVDMDELATVLRAAGVEVPWPAAAHDNDRSEP